MDLTPELFEKTEFTERRKGYDIEQVETFMEDAGTALAQLLVRVRHTEERASVAEGRLADAEAAIVDSGKKAVRATDDYVHENPWQSVGVAAGVAFLLGLLVSRR